MGCYLSIRCTRMGLRQPQFRRFSVKAKHLNRARRVYTAEHLHEAGLFDIWGQSRSSIVPFDFERRFSPGGEISDLRPRLSANRIIYTLPAGRSNHRLPWRPTTKSKLTSPHRWCLLQCHGALHSTPTTGPAESSFRSPNIRVTTPENPSKAQPISYLSQLSATRFENLSKMLQQQTTRRMARATIQSRLPWLSQAKH